MNITEAIAVACSNDYERGRRDAKGFDEVQYVDGRWLARGIRLGGMVGDRYRRGGRFVEVLEFESGDYLDGLAAGGCAVLEPLAGSRAVARVA